MSESSENAQYTFPEPKVMWFKVLVLSDQQFKIQKYSIFNDIKQKSSKPWHLRSWNQRIFGILALQMEQIMPVNYPNIAYILYIFVIYRIIMIKTSLTKVSVLLLCRMENSETSPSSGPLAVPDRDMVRPSGQLSESARSSKHREHSSKSPRRRRKGTRLQQRGGDHEQLLWEIERRRLPGQHEHLEPSGSASDPAESCPKRFALQVASWCAVPPAQLCCLGHEVMVSWLVLLFFSLHLTGEPTFYMDRIQPLTSDPKPVFFLTQLQSCKQEGAEWVVLCVYKLLVGGHWHRTACVTLWDKKISKSAVIGSYMQWDG